MQSINLVPVLLIMFRKGLYCRESVTVLVQLTHCITLPNTSPRKYPGVVPPEIVPGVLHHTGKCPSYLPGLRSARRSCPIRSSWSFHPPLESPGFTGRFSHIGNNHHRRTLILRKRST